jgi:hypothetical protein
MGKRRAGRRKDEAKIGFSAESPADEAMIQISIIGEYI